MTERSDRINGLMDKCETVQHAIGAESFEVFYLAAAGPRNERRWLVGLYARGRRYTSSDLTLSGALSNWLDDWDEHLTTCASLDRAVTPGRKP